MRQADRVVTDTSKPSVVRADVNMFVSNLVIVDAGSDVRWSNLSNLPHNVVGVSNQATTIAATNNTTTGGAILADSTDGKVLAVVVLAAVALIAIIIILILI